jgi:uncharacterized protein (DUF934 family)
MALLKRGPSGWTFTDDPYTAVPDGEALPGGPVAVSLARFLAERETLIARNSLLAVTLESDQPPEALAGDLDRISAIFLRFPKFRDGRGYSWARVLRQRYGYRGEVRAVGEVLRDQWLPLVRCGADALSVKPGTSLAAFQQALSEQTVFYQPSADGRGRIGRTPRRLAMAAAE